jgi:hypothetical protein
MPKSLCVPYPEYSLTCSINSNLNGHIIKILEFVNICEFELKKYAFLNYEETSYQFKNSTLLFKYWYH